MDTNLQSSGGGVGIMRFLAAGIVALTVSLSRFAFAEPPVPGACPPVGTILKTSVNETLVVTGADGLMCSVVDKNRSDNRPIYIYGLVSIKSGEFGDSVGYASI